MVFKGFHIELDAKLILDEISFTVLNILYMYANLIILIICISDHLIKCYVLHLVGTKFRRSQLKVAMKTMLFHIA